MITLVEKKTIAKYLGLSTDDKPMMVSDAVGMPNGSQFLEMDTGKKFYYDGDQSQWSEMSSSDDSGGGGDDSGGGGSLPEVTSADIGKVMTVTGKTVVVPKDSYQSGETVISGTLPDCFVEGAKLIGVDSSSGDARLFTSIVTKMTGERTYLSCTFADREYPVFTIFENENGGLSLQTDAPMTAEAFLYNFQKGTNIAPLQSIVTTEEPGSVMANGSIANYNYSAISGEYAIVVVNDKEMLASIIEDSSNPGTWYIYCEDASFMFSELAGQLFTFEAGTYKIAVYAVSVPVSWSAVAPAKSNIYDQYDVVFRVDGAPRLSPIPAEFVYVEKGSIAKFIEKINSGKMASAILVCKWSLATAEEVVPNMVVYENFWYVGSHEAFAFSNPYYNGDSTASPSNQCCTVYTSNGAVERCVFTSGFAFT